METASFHGLSGLTAIIDLNKLGQRGPTMHGWHADVFRDRAEAFGWGAIEIDGHDVAEIDAAYTHARNADRPTMIVARTEKGHGVSFLANAEGWHGKALSDEQAAAAIDELGGVRNLTITPPKPESFIPADADEAPVTEAPVFDGPIATRKAFGDALAWLATLRPELVVIDGEVGNSTYTDDVLAVAPERFLEVYIAEQTMVGAQIGMQALGKVAFSATFGAFYTRATDFVRMGAISRADLRLCGSHAGVSIGEDGPSQMALEDLATMRTLHSSTVLYPADGNATVKLVATMCDLPGISYIRTTREATPSLYGPDEEFPIGGSKTLASSPDDQVTLIGAGVTLHACMSAAETLAKEGVTARVIDCYSVKPIDAPTLRKALEETGTIVVVEDHRVEGGIGDAVLDALAGDRSAHGPGRQAGGDRDARLRLAHGTARLGGHRRSVDRGTGSDAGRVGQPLEVAARTPPSANAMISSGGTGRLNRYPCPIWQPRPIRKSSSPGVSIPSASVVIPNPAASSMNAVTMLAAWGSCRPPRRTNGRS